MRENIRLATTDKALSAIGGLTFFSTVFDRLIGGYSDLKELLPQNKISTTCRADEKLKAMVLGLIAGAENIDDMDRVRMDPAFVEINGGQVNASRTYLDFLQKFSNYSCKKLNHVLTEAALNLHKAQAKDSNFILSIDSSSNKQSGQKMEGLAYNYKNDWGLDTLMAFDQYGFQYWHDVRPGSTFTANGSTEVINEVLKRVPKGKNRYLLADSGFCNQDVFNAAINQRADFVIACRANMYERFIPTVKYWKDAKKIKFYDGRKVEIGQTFYYHEGVQKILRLIIIRAKSVREREDQTPLFQDTHYDYAAFVTTISEHHMKNEAIVELYRGRANCENFIKDLKHGFDMLHYPCGKLSANKAYGLMMAFAYNLVRYAGWLLNPIKPFFAKAVRFLLVHIPCQVVKHGRYITLKMPLERLKEVQRLNDKIKLSLGYYGSS